MKTKIKISGIFILTFFFAWPACAAPSISGVSGNLTPGASVTVMGSGFGTKNPVSPITWDDFEGGIINNEVQGTSPVVGSSWEINSSSQSSFPRFSNSVKRAGSDISVAHDFMGEGWENYNSSLSQTLMAEEYYFTFWWYYDKDPGFPWSRNTKPWILYGSSNGHLAYSGWGGAADSAWRSSLQDDGGGVDTTVWSEPSITSLDDKWIRIECWLKQSAPDVKNGQYRCWAHTGAAIGEPNIDITPAKTRVTTSVWVQLHIGTYNSRDDTSQGQGKAIIYTDDIYVDLTPARVELGNNASFVNCSHREIQIPTAWSQNSITISANQGAFQTGQQVYLYVIDANGEVNANGYPVTIGGGGGDTTLPGSPANLTVR